MPNLQFENLARIAARNGVIQLDPKRGIQPIVDRGDNMIAQLMARLKQDEVEKALKDLRNNQVKDGDVQRRLIENYKVAIQEAANAAIEKGWNELGGPKSQVGLPLHGVIKANLDFESKVGGLEIRNIKSDFRGGMLLLSSDGSQIESPERRLVSADLLGMECEVRQEKEDELYGVISILGPSNQEVAHVRFPSSGDHVVMGADGDRILNLNIPIIVAQPLQNYIIWVSLVEGDSGDTNEIANKIAGKISEAAKAFIGGLTGVPAESASDTDDFKQKISDGLNWVFTEILGMGDDPYGAGSLRLGWDELYEGAYPIGPNLHRRDDPKTISGWTHKLTVEGSDDAGDRGRYSFYFKVWTEVVTIPVTKQL